MNDYFKNRLRGYNVVLAALKAFSNDICKNCIDLQREKIKVIKGLGKLNIDLEASKAAKDEKTGITSQIEQLTGVAEDIEVGDDLECQKTAGNCTIGPACFTNDGAMALMDQITEPVSL